MSEWGVWVPEINDWLEIGHKKHFTREVATQLLTKVETAGCVAYWGNGPPKDEDKCIWGVWHPKEKVWSGTTATMTLAEADSKATFPGSLVARRDPRNPHAEPADLSDAHVVRAAPLPDEREKCWGLWFPNADGGRWAKPDVPMTLAEAHRSRDSLSNHPDYADACIKRRDEKPESEEKCWGLWILGGTKPWWSRKEVITHNHAEQEKIIFSIDKSYIFRRDPLNPEAPPSEAKDKCWCVRSDVPGWIVSDLTLDQAYELLDRYRDRFEKAHVGRITKCHGHPKAKPEPMPDATKKGTAVISCIDANHDRLITERSAWQRRADGAERTVMLLKDELGALQSKHKLLQEDAGVILLENRRLKAEVEKLRGKR